MADATLKTVREFFGIDSATQFRQEWMRLSDIDRAQLKAGLGDGTLNY